MSEIDSREASLADWPKLELFFREHYREGHPLRQVGYFAWLIEQEDFGRSFIAVVDDRVVAHLGMTMGGEVSWVIQLFVEERYRGRGIVRDLYGLARRHGPLATTNANSAALGMYRRMGWIRYCDLQRFVAVNPREQGAACLVRRVKVGAGLPTPVGTHYWEQPGLVGLQLSSGSTGVRQDGVGGLRIIDLVDPESVLDEVWAVGYRWVDFMTSWNDPVCRVLEDAGWFMNSQCPVPWLLDPVVPESVARVSFLAENPLPRDLIVSRSYCDHGRVGSLR